MRRFIFLILTIAAAAVLACAQPERSSIRDDAGREVALSRKPLRIVSLAPNLTEIVCFIGGEPLLAGVDDSSDYPASVAGLPRVGGAEPSVEKIVSLRPDLVIGRTNGSHPALARALADLGVPLFLVRTERLQDVPRAMQTLGELLQLPTHEDAVRRFNEQLRRQRRTRVNPPRVLFMVWPDPLYVAGHDTYADDLIRLAGGRTALENGIGGWPQLSIEPLIEASPDVILYPQRAVGGDHLERLFAGDSRWKSIGAVMRGSVIGVDDDVFSRQGPRLALAAAQLNAILDRTGGGQ